MATQTTHFDMVKQQSAEHVSVGLLNDNFDIIDQVMYNNQEKSEQLADEYNAGTTYNVGDYVRRENFIYKCNTASTTGVWDSTKWDRVKITDELGGGGGGSSTLAGLNDVNISSPTDGQALVFDNATQKWVNGAGGGGSSTFAGLNDVNVQGVSNGDIARFNSSTNKWEKSSDLTDLELSVSQLSSSVLNIAGDVDTLELTVSQMSASTLPYDANTSTKQKIDEIESKIETSVTKQFTTTKFVDSSLISVKEYGNFVNISLTGAVLNTNAPQYDALIGSLPKNEIGYCLARIVYVRNNVLNDATIYINQNDTQLRVNNVLNSGDQLWGSLIYLKK